MTLKPNATQPPKKVQVWLGSSEDTGWRSVLFSPLLGLRHILVKRRFWRRARIAFVVGFAGGILSALLLQFPNLNLMRFLDQPWLPTMQLPVTQPQEIAKASPGLTQPRLWSHAAKLAAYLGHLPYAKTNPDQLTLFSSLSDRATNFDEYLHHDAAVALLNMMDAAQKDRVSILLVSGFRDVVTQNKLYQERIQEVGTEAEAAKSVAPPGYSEHHTGYAIDVTDGSGLDYRDFAQTPAFQWMVIHAHEFGFELSFPDKNPQGVDYEPWHWRFVNTPTAAQIFAAARGQAN